jgi:hypothetical protein
VLFSLDAHEAVAAGDITVTFRRWTRAQVKVGGHYKVGNAVLEVDDVSTLRVREISEHDLAKAGVADRTALLERLGRGSKRAVEEDEVVWRVEFHPTGLTDARTLLAASADLTDADVDAINRALDRLDRAAARGPWTRAVLALIAARPGVVSTELAAERDMERAPFKLDVRKLKKLGLTDSLEVGYRLSPRGRVVLERLVSDPC